MEENSFNMFQIYHDRKVAGLFDVMTEFKKRHSTDEYNKAHQFLMDRGYIKMQSGQHGTPPTSGHLFEITDIGKIEYEKEEKEQVNRKAKAEIEKSILINQDRLLRSQLDINPIIKTANESTVITNDHTRRTNNRLMGIFAVTALFSLLGFGVAALTYNLELTKYGEGKLLRQAQPTISQLNSSLQEKDVRLGLQKKTIDSLKKIVSVVKPSVVAGGK